MKPLPKTLPATCPVKFSKEEFRAATSGWDLKQHAKLNAKLRATPRSEWTFAIISATGVIPKTKNDDSLGALVAEMSR